MVFGPVEELDIRPISGKEQSPSCLWLARHCLKYVATEMLSASRYLDSRYLDSRYLDSRYLDRRRSGRVSDWRPVRA